MRRGSSASHNGPDVEAWCRPSGSVNVSEQTGEAGLPPRDVAHTHGLVVDSEFLTEQVINLTGAAQAEEDLWKRS
jgi:hypothetical protein